MYDEICRTCGDEKIAQMFNASKEEVSATTRILEIFACGIRNLGRKSPEIPLKESGIQGPLT